MKIVCVGRNYAKHIAELHNEKPADPVLFIKPDSAVLPPRNPLYLPDFAQDFHYEVELVIKIKKLGKHIAPEFAHRYYDEIGLGIDVTARDLQSQLKAKGLPWEKAKAFDNSAVVSKEFLPKTGFKDLNDIHFSLNINGETVQQGHTAEMLWKIDELISYISKFFTLKKGDLIFTGTPAGVGKMNINDTFTGYIEGREMFKVRIK
jgi:2-keto-4-pentenoate hydratase/2-oxohepta-3-ene-1,7-dioic acid hydratase in catechol pathway